MLYTQKKFGTGFNSDKYKEGYDQIDWGNSEKEEEIQPASPPWPIRRWRDETF